MIPDRCCDIKKRRSASVSDCGRRIVIHYPRSQLVTIVALDNCVYPQSTCADFLVRSENNDVIIELKGKDVLHALNQVELTIVKLNSDGVLNKKTSGVVFAKSVPRTNTLIQSKKNQIAKSLGVKVLISSSSYEFNFD